MAVSKNWADLPLNCPRCGHRLQFSHVRSADGEEIDVAVATEVDIHVYRCAQHGHFQFSRDVPVRPGD